MKSVEQIREQLNKYWREYQNAVLDESDTSFSKQIDEMHDLDVAFAKYEVLSWVLEDEDED